MDLIVDQFLADVAALGAGPQPQPARRSARQISRKHPLPSASPTELPQAAPSPQVQPLRGDYQLVTPSIDWNWPVAASGSIPALQFFYADTLPKSVTPGAAYAASSESFSDNYRLYLNMIDQTRFPALSVLQKAIQKITEPSGSPASTPNPDGWTKLSRSGVLRWAPNWMASDTSEDWLAKVKTGKISNPGTISLDIRNQNVPASVAGGTTNSQRDLSAQLSQFSTVQISAQDWGRIELYPGDWLNTGLLQLGQPYVPDAKTFFGSNGILNSRVSSLLVGYDIQIRFSGSTALTADAQTQLLTDKKLEVLGMPVTLRSSAGLSDPAPVADYDSDNSSPVIVAMEIERFNLTTTS